MPHLSTVQKDAFWRDGYLMIDDAIDDRQLAALRDQFARWVEESRAHAAPYGRMLDGRPRFDVQPGHSREKPALRRVASPTELSDDYLAVLTRSRLVDVVAELIGPDVRFHHGKINSKLPGSGTEVKWHQDFAYTPHTNDDIITALTFVDEVTAENGPLQVVAGSHRGPIQSLWQDGVFTGTVEPALVADLVAKSAFCLGRAGAACLMHTRLLHASEANRSSRPRTLFICDFAAADAIALSPNPLPSRHAGMIVRGTEPGRVRAISYEMELPEYPKGASFFEQQAKHKDTVQ